MKRLFVALLLFTAAVRPLTADDAPPCLSSLHTPVSEEATPPQRAPSVGFPEIRSTEEGTLIELPPRRPRAGHTYKSSVAISGLYVAAFAIMWNLPEDATNWEKEEMWERFLDGFSKGPVWDDDEWATNWVLHPWWGMWVYNSQRNYGESMLRSFLVATAHSLFFEYAVEAWTERPSTQDLLSTSPIGALMGELVHRWIKRMGRDGFSRGERVLIDFVNPAYRWQIGFNRPVR